MPTHDELAAWIRGRTTRELLSLLEALEGALDLPDPGAPEPVTDTGMGPPLGDPRHDPRFVDVVLVDPGPDRVLALKLIREYTAVTLIEARELLQRVPVTLRESVPRDEAERWVELFAPPGARFELR